MGTSSQRPTPKLPEWQSAARVARKAVKTRVKADAVIALLEFGRANGGLGKKGKSVVPVDIGRLSALISHLLEFLQECEENGLEEALEKFALEAADETASGILAALLEGLLKDWPPVLRDLIRAALLEALKQATPDEAQTTLDRLSLSELGQQGIGNLVTELVAHVLVKAYFHQLQAALDRTNPDNKNQRIHRSQVVEAARQLVAEVFVAWQEDLDDADWGSKAAANVVGEALDELVKRLSKGPA